MTNRMQSNCSWLVLTIFVVFALGACNAEPVAPIAEVVDTSAALSAKTNETTNTTTDVALQKEQITVYKSPTCGCCKEWVTYLEEEGFAVTAIDHDNVDSIKAELGLPDPSLKSCHTAIVDGYIIEGHVPANDIERLLSERPTDIKGLSAPGMPMMSPGMASRTPKDYAVLSFTESGETEVFSQY